MCNCNENNKTNIVNSMLKNFDTAFHGKPISIDNIAYAEHDNTYICGITEKDTDDTFSMEFKGELKQGNSTERISYKLSISTEDGTENANEILFTVDTSYVNKSHSIVITLSDNDFSIKTTALHVDDNIIKCLIATGIGTVVECIYKCGRDIKCWKKCAKEKWVSIGIDITKCLMSI